VLRSSDRIADRLLEALARLGVVTVDLRTAFRAATEPLYWHADYHIDTAGHRIVAEALAPVVQDILSPP
jgi:hypothetical protein